MAYGRLDVFWPDGQFMTFPLVENNISVGRSTGNTIVLDTSTISRYHLSLTHDGENVFVTDLDSANGTFVDGTRLITGQRHPLYGGEEIQIGQLRFVYHHLDEQPTQPMSAVEEATQRIELRLPAFRLDVITPDIAISPGAHTSAELLITNTSESEQQYTVTVTGIPAEWVRLDRSRLTIPPDDSAQVLVNFRPLRRSDSKPGVYPVVVRVAQANDPEAHLDAAFEVRILAFSGFGMALDARRVTGNERFRLHLHNQGSAPLTLSLAGRDRGDKLRFILPTPQITLAPGQRLVTQGEISPRAPALVGKPRAHSFDLVARSNDAARFTAAVSGVYLEKPRLPAWVPLALAGATVLAGLLLILFVGTLLITRPPRILSFTVVSTQVPIGQPVGLNWAVQDAQRLDLLVNQTPAATGLSPQSSGAPLDTSGLSGSVEIRLVARSRDETAEAVQNVYVYRPLGDGFLVAAPAQLVRSVVQSLTISWDIPGAISTRLTGLESFSTAPLLPVYSASEELSGIVGIASAPLTLVLDAEDEVGNRREQTLTIPVVVPECRPARDAVTLYAGPDVRYQTVATVPFGAVVPVEAQDGSSLWLKIGLPGGISGWGAMEAFDCGGLFDPRMLIKDLSVPTLPPPSITPTPGLTGTPSPTARARVPNLQATPTPGAPAALSGPASASPTATAAG